MAKKWVENKSAGPIFIGGRMVLPGEGEFDDAGPLKLTNAPALTAAEFATLCAAGLLTVGSFYNVDGAVQQALSTKHAVEVVSRSSVGRQRLCFFGDSITNRIGAQGQPVTANPVSNTVGGRFGVMWADMECNAGSGSPKNGTVSYNASTKLLTWQAPMGGVDSGDTVGVAVDGSKTGVIYLPSGTPGNGLWLNWLGGDAAAGFATGTIVFTVAQNGLQVYGYDSKSFCAIAAAVTGHRFRLAPSPASYPVGMAGIYGIGGATAAELLSAQWQWAEMPSDVDFVQIGTNDFSLGATVSVATYLANIQAFITARLASGTSVVVWSTILPRTSDTAVERAKKAQAARGMETWAKTQGGRVLIYDLSSIVTNMATGGWPTTPTAWSDGAGIHPLTLGAVRMGEAVGNFLATLAPTQRVLTWQNQDLYDATYNLTGNIVKTSLGMAQMAGTTGTYGATRSANVGAWASASATVGQYAGQPCLTAAGNLYVATNAGGTTGAIAPSHQSGTALDGTVSWLFVGANAVVGVATNWLANLSTTGASGNVAGAKVPRTDGVNGDWQALFLWNASAVAEAETGDLITQGSISSGIAQGTYYDSSAEITIVGCKNLQYLDYLPAISSASARQVFAISVAGNDPWPDRLTPLSLVARTPPGYAGQPGTGNCQPKVTMRLSSAGGVGWCALLIGRLGIRIGQP